MKGMFQMKVSVEQRSANVQIEARAEVVQALGAAKAGSALPVRERQQWKLDERCGHVQKHYLQTQVTSQTQPVGCRSSTARYK